MTFPSKENVNPEKSTNDLALEAIKELNIPDSALVPPPEPDLGEPEFNEDEEPDLEDEED